jgi:hypothetical protein
MNVYLDIDGVLLANEENLAIGAIEFIKYAVEHFDVYWLTTHCMDGTTEHAIEYLNRAAEEDLRPWLEKFKPVIWSLKKTEAIDFSKPISLVRRRLLHRGEDRPSGTRCTQLVDRD